MVSYKALNTKIVNVTLPPVSSNRTFMELKFWHGLFEVTRNKVLIVPLWN